MTRKPSSEDALWQLTVGPLSGLTPAQRVSAASANFDRLLDQVVAGNANLIPDLEQAGTQAVQVSQQVYGDAKQTANLRARVIKTIERERERVRQQLGERATTRAGSQSAADTGWKKNSKLQHVLDLLREGHIPGTTVPWESFIRLLAERYGTPRNARGFSLPNVKALKDRAEKLLRSEQGKTG